MYSFTSHLHLIKKSDEHFTESNNEFQKLINLRIHDPKVEKKKNQKISYLRWRDDDSHEIPWIRDEYRLRKR